MLINKNKFIFFIAVSVILLISSYSQGSDISTVESSPKSAITSLNVYKRANCSCCNKWASYMRENGFQIKVHSLDNLSTIKARYNISQDLRSCHTSASTNGFVFEGHIPAKFIKQFLNNVPENASGLALPAMPLGTPGMEYGSRFNPYIIYLTHIKGIKSIYADVISKEEQL
ncbi:MAG TPA: DUF411 domain-containing protein [Aeromonadales bacterium]|nr:DUF411 domain-containing protein [Aeromonadales bacterium]